MPQNKTKKVCILASVFWPIYPGFGGRHGYVLAENLLKAGYEVDVVTAFPIDLMKKGNFFSQRLISKEKLNGIRVFRVFSLLPTGPGIPRKFLFYISFMFTSLMALPLVRKTHFVLGLHPPPTFLVLPGLIFSRLLRGKYVLRVTDLWPDVVFDFNLVSSKPLERLIVRMTNLTYKLADNIMAFTPHIKERIQAFGVPEGKISMIEMAVDTAIFQPIPEVWQEGNELSLPNTKDKFAVLYSGAFALTYDFDTLLEAAKILKEDDILFVLLGDGDAKGQILSKIDELNLKNVIMPAPVSNPEMVARYINYSDLCVIPLKPEMVTSMLTRPSKVFEFWSCGKPVVSCTQGELEALTNESGAGVVISPGDPESLATTIRYLHQNPQVATEMGRRGREFAMRRFSYESLRTNLTNLLNQL